MQTNTNNEGLSNQTDSAEDLEKMQPEETTIDLPNVEDIPGQEHIKPAPLGELADVTASSADEEADDLLDDGDDTMNDDTGSNVTRQEREDLETAANDMPGDDENLRRAALDDTDEDGTPLNEKSFGKTTAPDDLDVPGAGLDDDNEAIGEEDEENNPYSLGGDDNEDAPRDDF